MAKEECRGCYLIRLMSEDCDPSKLTCQQEEHDCPCKTCLVKVTCTIVGESGGPCEKYIDFNMKHPPNDFWREYNKNSIEKWTTFPKVKP